MENTPQEYTIDALRKFIRQSGANNRLERTLRRKTKNKNRAVNRLARKNRRLNLRKGNTAGKQ